MTPEALLKFVQDNCYKAPAFSVSVGLFNQPQLNQLLLNYFGPNGLQLASVDAPVLIDRLVHVKQGKFSGPWLNVATWEVALKFSIEQENNVVLEMNMSLPNTTYTLGTSFISLTEQVTGILPLSATAFTLRSNEPAPKTFLPLQQRYAGQLYLTDEDDKRIAPLQMKATVAFPETMRWLDQWVPENMRSLTGLIQLNKLDRESPRFLINSPEYTFALNNTISLSMQMQAIAVWIGEKAEVDANVCNATFMRFTATLKYKTPEGDQIALPVSCVWGATDPRQLVIEAQTGAAVSYALQKFAALFGGINLTPFLPEGVSITELVTLKTITLQVNTADRKIEFIAATLGLPDDRKPFPILPDIADLTKLKFNFSVIDPFGKPTVGVELNGALTFKNAPIKGAVEAGLSLPSGTFYIGLAPVASINLTALYKQLLPGAPVPVADLRCNELSLRGQFRPAKFKLAANVSSKEGIDLYFLKVKDLGFVFDYDKGQADSKSLELYGTAYIGEKIEIQVSATVASSGFKFAGSLTPIAGKELKLSDLLPANIPLPQSFADTTIKKIAATFSTSPAALSFELVCKSVLDLGTAGKVQFDGLKIEVSRDTDGYTFKFETSGKVQLIPAEGKPNGLIDLGGTIKIERTPKKFTMNFTAYESALGITLPLLIPSKIQNGIPEFSEALFTPQTIGFTWDEDGWEIESSFLFKITKTWDKLQAILPKDGFSVKLSIGNTEATIKLEKDIIDRVVPDFVVPGLNDQYGPLNLGKSRFTVGETTLRLVYGQKTELSVDADVSYYLPTHLNNLFGRNADQTPKLEILETYNPTKPTTPFALRFRAGYIDGGFKATASLQRFPIKNLAETEDKKAWLINLGALEPKDKLGEYGCVRIDKPVMNLDLAAASFTASGGWEIVKPLALPLDLLKNLVAVGSPELAKRLPKKIDIPSKIEFFKDNKFDPQAVNKFFLGLLPEGLIDALGSIANQTVDKFPDAIKPYFNFGLPDKLRFDFVVTATASASFDLKIPEPGMRILFIQPVPSPYILGVTIRKFSFGQILGGQAFRIKIDGEFDTFDIVSLAASMIAQPSWYPYIGEPSRYHSTLMLHDLIVLVFYQGGIPIPVPIFYKKVGIDFYGIGGTTFKSSFEFPEPDWSKLGEFLVNLILFFTDKTKRMPETGNVAPTIKFTIGQNYFQSDLLKIGPLGLTEPFTPVDLYRFIATIMNTVKFFDVEEFIRSIPLDKRVGAIDSELSFVCISKIKARWLLCTPYEFTTGGLSQRFLLPEEKADLFTRLIPAKGTTSVGEKGKGMVLFARGKWETSFGVLEAGFGVVARDTRKFATGFFLKGKVAGLFEIDALAFLSIDPPDRPLQAYGKTSTLFTLIGLQILTGETTITIVEDPNKLKEFRVDGRFTLLDLPPFFSIKSEKDIGGELSTERLDVRGDIALVILGFIRFSGRAEIGSKGIDFYVKVAIVEYRLTVKELAPFKIQIGGTLPFGLTNMSLDVIIANPPEPQPNYATITTKMSFLELLDLEVSSTSAIYPTPPSFNGVIKLYLLRFLNPNPVIQGGAKINAGGFSITSRFALLPEGSVVNIIGDSTLTIGEGNFLVDGGAELIFGPIKIGGKLIVSEREGIRFYTTDGAFDVRVKVCKGHLYLIGTVKIWIFPPAEGHITTRSFPYIFAGYPGDCPRDTVSIKTKRIKVYRHFMQAQLELTGKLVNHPINNKRVKNPKPLRTTLVNKAYRVVVERKSEMLRRKSNQVTYFKYTRLAKTARGQDLFTELLAHLRSKLATKQMAYLPVATGAVLNGRYSESTGMLLMEFQFPKATKNQLGVLSVELSAENIGEAHALLLKHCKAAIRELMKKTASAKTVVKKKISIPKKKAVVKAVSKKGIVKAKKVSKVAKKKNSRK